MEESNSIEIPSILTQVNKEKFRRRLLIGSRLLALFLIIAIFYFAYTQYKYGIFIENKSQCYLCGYYQGKQCEPVYYSPTDSLTPEERLIEIAKYNDKEWPLAKESYTILNRPQLNLSGLGQS